MDTQAVLRGLNKLVWFRHRRVPARLYRITKLKYFLEIDKITWWSPHRLIPALTSSIWIEHLNGNLVRCLEFQVTNCQTVVGSFSFLKEEQLVRPQVTVGALVVHPGPVVSTAIFSESDSVSQETRHPGVPRRRLPVHPDPAVFVVAVWSELLILWKSCWRTPSYIAIFRIILRP